MIKINKIDKCIAKLDSNPKITWVTIIVKKHCAYQRTINLYNQTIDKAPTSQNRKKSECN